MNDQGSYESAFNCYKKKKTLCIELVSTILKCLVILYLR